MFLGLDLGLEGFCFHCFLCERKLYDLYVGFAYYNVIFAFVTILIIMQMC
jgi:hypothetical protein